MQISTRSLCIHFSNPQPGTDKEEDIFQNPGNFLFILISRFHEQSKAKQLWLAWKFYIFISLHIHCQWLSCCCFRCHFVTCCRLSCCLCHCLGCLCLQCGSLWGFTLFLHILGQGGQSCKCLSRRGELTLLLCPTSPDDAPSFQPGDRGVGGHRGGSGGFLDIGD